MEARIEKSKTGSNSVIIGKSPWFISGFSYEWKEEADIGEGKNVSSRKNNKNINESPLA